jgi:translation initiation factor IF-1
MAGRNRSSKPGASREAKDAKRQEKAEDVIRTEGVVLEALPNTTFMIKLDSGHELLSYVSGKMRMNYIRILPGDRVVLEISKYDPSKGRIVYRK